MTLTITSNSVTLSWSEAQDDGSVMGYDLYRDNERIKSMLNATEYTDATVLPFTDYQYRVHAVDVEGNQGPAATIDVFTPESVPAISIENYVALTKYVFGLYQGVDYTDTIFNTFRFVVAQEPIPANELDINKAINCDVGEASVRANRVSGSTVTNASVYYDQCEWEFNTYQGYVDTTHASLFGAVGMGPDNYLYNNFSIENAIGETASISGYVDHIPDGCRHGQSYREWNAYLGNYRADSEDAITELTNVKTQFVSGNVHCLGTIYSQFSGALEVKSTATGNHKLSVFTTVPFRNNSYETGSYLLGQLRVIADDATMLILDADNGNPLSVTVSLTTNGVTETFEELWDAFQ